MTQKTSFEHSFSQAIATAAKTPSALSNEPVEIPHGENWNDFSAPAATYESTAPAAINTSCAGGSRQ